MSAYAFFIQTCREEQKRQYPEDNVIFKEFSARCAERWKTLPQEVKQHFSDMAAQDRARYAKELQSYTGPRIRNRRRRTRKDPRAPKRALSAFFWFCMDERPKVRAQDTSAPVGMVAKQLGALWAKAGPELRQKYEALALADKGRYEDEMTAYRAGTFQRHVPGTEDLPPAQQARRYTYAPQEPVRYGPVHEDMEAQHQYLGHTIGCNVTPEAHDSGSPAGSSSENSVSVGSASSQAQNLTVEEVQQSHEQMQQQSDFEAKRREFVAKQNQEAQMGIGASGHNMAPYSTPNEANGESQQCGVGQYYSNKMYEGEQEEIPLENDQKYQLLPE